MHKFVPLAFAIASASLAHAADIVVEEKSLSTPPAQTRPLPAAQPIQSQTVTETGPSMQWQLYQQVQQLQQEMRDLRGQLEVQANIIERMKQDARSRYLDLDQRITQLKNTPPAPVEPAAQTPVTVPTTPAATTPATTPETPAAPNPDDEKKAYLAAYEVFRTGGPNKAINPMRNFIKTYPQSTFTPSAYYWLGEFYLAASPADVNNARKSFKIVADQYPDSQKAAAALLKLGSLADADGKTQDAIKYMLTLVRNFPGSPEAGSARGYLSAQNVAIPGDKTKPKADSKPAAAGAKPKSSQAPAPDKDDKTKSKLADKAKHAA